MDIFKLVDSIFHSKECNLIGYNENDQYFIKLNIIYRKPKSVQSEKNEGYIEYKWKLINIERHKLIKLITQMNYRLNEGNGKCIYFIGFSDKGNANGIIIDEMKMTLYNIITASIEIKSTITKILIFNSNMLFWAKIFLSR